jgi:hypothetical protein
MELVGTVSGSAASAVVVIAVLANQKNALAAKRVMQWSGRGFGARRTAGGCVRRGAGNGAGTRDEAGTGRF